MFLTEEQPSSGQSLMQLEKKLQLERFKQQGVYLSSINGLGETLLSPEQGANTFHVSSPIDGVQLAEISGRVSGSPGESGA